MSLIRRLVEQRALTASDVVRAALGAPGTTSGLRVSEKTALRLMTVFTCVKILSEGFAQVPLKVYRRMPDGSREELRSHPLYRVLHERPNPEMTSYTLRLAWMEHLALWGNAYGEIQRNFLGETIGLWPLLPDRVRAYRRADGIWYEIRRKTDPASQERSDAEIIHLPARDVLHIVGLSFDGLVGRSVIATVRDGMGLAAAYEDFGARFFSNDATPGFVLTTDQYLAPAKYKEMKTQWEEEHQQIINAHKFAILHGGLKPASVGIPPKDAQYVEARKYQRGEIAGLFRIPPHMIGDTEKASSWGTGIKEMSQGFIKFTLDPWFVNAEQSINAKLLGAPAQGPIYCEFDRDGFLRGDPKSRIEEYKALFDMGVISNAIIARLENLPAPPREVYAIPQNVTPLDRLDEVVDKQTEPAPAPVAPGENVPQDDDIRRRIAAHVPAFVEVAEAVLERERRDVGDGLAKRLRRDDGPEALADWLDGLYDELRTFAARRALATIRSMAETVRVEVAHATGREVPVLAETTRECTESMADRLVRANSAELRAAVVAGQAAAKASALLDRTAERIGAEECGRAGDLLAQAAYAAVGLVRKTSHVDAA
jgi:HK97 family phage portal protein